MPARSGETSDVAVEEPLLLALYEEITQAIDFVQTYTTSQGVRRTATSSNSSGSSSSSSHHAMSVVVEASDEQQLRDAIRPYAVFLRQLQPLQDRVDQLAGRLALILASVPTV